MYIWMFENPVYLENSKLDGRAREWKWDREIERERTKTLCSEQIQ